MAKSSISELQELSIKQGYMPIYDFSVEGNSVNFRFVCNVSCKELKATGAGSSKKEAKHNAAQNMLLLMNPDKAVLTNTLVSPSANVTQSPAKVYEMPSSFIQPPPSATIHCNYIGMLQEFCQQQKIPLTDVLYKMVYDDGSLRDKTYTIEVKVGSRCERGTSYCKKLAKQEAAKKLLLRLNPSAANSNSAYMLNIDKLESETLENNIRKLGTGVLDDVKERNNEIKLKNDRAKSLHLEHRAIKQESNNPSMISDSHNLFETNYASKFHHSIRENMRIIRDNFTDQMDFGHIRQNIENTLKVKIQETIMPSITKDRIICLQLSTNPRITQVGMGETVPIARSRATYNLIVAILIFLNI